MSAASPAADALLAAGVAAQWLCALGVAVMPGAFNKLHYAGAGSTLGPVLVVAAAVVHLGWTVSGLEAVVVALVLVLSAPAMTMALARAARRSASEPEGPSPSDLEGMAP